LLVRSGEFDVVKAASSVQMIRQEAVEREQEQVRKMVQMERQKREMAGNGEQGLGGKPLASRVRKEVAGKRVTKKSLPFIVATLGPGELFGDYECYGAPKNCAFEFSLVCRSVKGEILELDKAEFARRIGVFPEVIPRISERSKEKRFLYYRQIINNKAVQ
jgi:CRP-like cAMP-binding protein